MNRSGSKAMGTGTRGWRLLLSPLAPWRDLSHDFLASLDRATAAGPLPLRLGLVLVCALVAWWIYVPIHELLHALGCAATGGTVERLRIQARYGGQILSRIFPFVSAGGVYAGQLEKFDTGGSDLTYLATVLLPYLLTVAGAVPLLRLAARRASPILLGAALVLAIAPLVGVPGDLYEAGSILVSAGLSPLWPAGWQPSPLALRHDDVGILLREFDSRFPSHSGIFGIGILVSALAGFLLGSGILFLSEWAARRLGLPPTAPRPEATPPPRPPPSEVR